MNSFLFVAGDPSGDERAAEVVREIKSRDPACRVTALGGPALKAAADRFLYDLVAESVMGFWEPLKKIPRFWRILNGVVRPALREETGVVVPTDFYGFNRHVAAAAKAAGRRVVYYVSPQVWASRPGRIDVLKKAVDRVLVIFPFEEALYRERGVPVTFVGHPLIDALPPADPDAPLNVEATVGLLPGSRPGEVRRLLPVMLEAAERLTAARPACGSCCSRPPACRTRFTTRSSAARPAGTCSWRWCATRPIAGGGASTPRWPVPAPPRSRTRFWESPRWSPTKHPGPPTCWPA
ncbi:MAG: hypothetical protein IPO76_04920 [Elusimicrobia bacterium]|nr:hypothetical protein [Elusimicrobiota bacterium]